jgi:putative RNA 2'-phosphotransferase
MDTFIAISKYLSYLLRHHPNDLPMTRDGFVPIQQVLSKVQKKYPEVNREFIKQLVNQRNKRFQIRNDKIRALYGHSIPVTIDLDKDDQTDILYHGTSQQSAEKILQEGLKSKGRNKVHLSASKQEAMRVGKRHSDQPVILKIDVAKARENGFCFEKATKNVFLTDFIPSIYIHKITNNKMFFSKISSKNLNDTDS